MKCINSNDGSLLTQYMLYLLNEEDQRRFEDHLMNCESCHLALLNAAPELVAIGTNKKHVLEALQAEGISFEGLREELMSIKKKGRFQESLGVLSIRIAGLLRTKRIAIATGLFAVAVLIVLLFKGPAVNNSYLPRLSFEKFAYQESSTRAVAPTIASNPLFSKGMKAYSENDYKNAIMILKAATVESPKEWSAWFFLGASYYLDRQAKPAIAALLEADNLNRYSLEIEIKWYLAQAYLLDNAPNKALPYLQWLEEKPGEYSPKAKELVKSIQEVNAK